MRSIESRQGEPSCTRLYATRKSSEESYLLTEMSTDLGNDSMKLDWKKLNIRLPAHLMEVFKGVQVHNELIRRKNDHIYQRSDFKQENDSSLNKQWMGGIQC
ncbi:hypothetical protein E2C01_063895 [Portunus trituberculatus]|uniref:Uncharacterized protein n=1 Tax=Portunus trituberculatus TaxID=210409 RepID=A0A5B7HJE7_PORTR|nr:hypothetical protein [Portunus trituberculatus]